MRIERIEIKVPGGEVPGIAVVPRSPRGAAVIAHGYGGCKEEQLGLAVRVAECGLAACAIDLRGHGQHPLPLDDAVPDDLEAAIERFRDYGKVVAIGHSLGGRLALISGADFAIGISPPLDPDYCVRTQELLHKVRSYRVKEQRTGVVFEYLKGLPALEDGRSGRMLVIYGSRDVPEIVDSCNGLKAAGANVLRIEGARHGDTYQLESTFAAIAEQLARWFRGRTST